MPKKSSHKSLTETTTTAELAADWRAVLECLHLGLSFQASIWAAAVVQVPGRIINWHPSGRRLITADQLGHDTDD
jgi:hypothetical protein